MDIEIPMIIINDPLGDILINDSIKHNTENNKFLIMLDNQTNWNPYIFTIEEEL